jgi:hypothetical protein
MKERLENQMYELISKRQDEANPVKRAILSAQIAAIQAKLDAMG